MHWNGTEWSIIPSPSPGRQNNLNGVAAISPNDVWAVGRYATDRDETFVLHWEGSQWSIVPSPTRFPYAQRLHSVSAVAADDVWAVGKHGTETRDETLVFHWDGTEWTEVPSPNPGLIGSHLRDVSALSAEDVWAAGTFWDGFPYQFRTLTLRYSDSCTSSTPTPTPTPCPMIFIDVHPTDYYYEAVRYLYCAGVISGYSDGTFRPGNPATRGQIAKIVYNAITAP